MTPIFAVQWVLLAFQFKLDREQLHCKPGPCATRNAPLTSHSSLLSSDKSRNWSFNG